MSSYDVLRNLGFSKAAVACYENLFKDGGASAQQLIERIGTPRASLYRSLRQLEAAGFVAAVKTERQPTYFYAQPLEIAFRRYADYQQRMAAKLMEEQTAALAARFRKPPSL